MKRLLLLFFVAWLAAPAAGHAQSPDTLKALADLAVDDADKREAAVTAHRQHARSEVARVPGSAP